MDEAAEGQSSGLKCLLDPGEEGWTAVWAEMLCSAIIPYLST